MPKQTEGNKQKNKKIKKNKKNKKKKKINKNRKIAWENKQVNRDWKKRKNISSVLFHTQEKQ